MSLSDGDIVRCTIETVADTGVIMNNSLHYVVKADTAFLGNEPTVADVLSKVSGHLTTAYRDLIPTGYTVRQWHGYEEVRTWLGEVAQAGDLTVGSAGTATMSSSLMPRPIAGVIDLKSDVASRSARGWILIPGPVNAAMMDGTGKFAVGAGYYNYATTFAALLDDSVQSTVLGVNSWHIDPVIYSRTRRKRGESTYWFGVKAAQFKTDPRWVARRRTIP